jgi:hypothetical protein
LRFDVEYLNMQLPDLVGLWKWKNPRPVSIQKKEKLASQNKILICLELKFLGVT